MNSIRLKRQLFSDGTRGQFYGFEEADIFYQIYLIEPFRPSFQPLFRFDPAQGSPKGVTEHRIILSKGCEALLRVDDSGRIRSIRSGGHEVDYFEVPYSHEFFDFVFTKQPIANMFKNKVVD